ncbi:hypothetical protein GALMADRAFT_241390 [Galerina marginata CBS 339.88]|uniref:F-box domain-containing protein n=1 Tax=Galerina marginata (strain CBS 339.88) TaxID=685588 RepID=A0A067TEW8_GALM3|nr:hypothetical protein GALMADRAFT_241390 [Galerina marginata CBS 339.88]
MPPNLPSELIDLIIGRVAQFASKTEHNHALSSTALVSHSFRFRAHSHLFSDVIISSNTRRFDQATERLDVLRKLIDADRHSECNGIASHIRTFELSISRPYDDEDSKVMAATMVAIIGKIFKTGTSPCSFSLTFNGHWRWESLEYFGPGFNSAFQDICRNPRLSTLRLSYLYGMPMDLLRHSSVKNISFIRVAFMDLSLNRTSTLADNPGREVFESSQAVCPESIETDFIYTYPLTSILDMTPNKDVPPNLLFSKLRVIVFHLYWSEKEEWDQAAGILANAAPTLEKLTLKLNSRSTCVQTPVYVFADLIDIVGLPDLPPHLTLHHLPLLKTLILSPLTNFLSSSISKEINFIFRHQDHLPPSLENVELCFFFVVGPEDNPSDIFGRFDFSALDGFFSESRFHALTSLTFRCDVHFRTVPRPSSAHGLKEQFLENSRSSLLRRFPCISAEHKSLVFDAVITCAKVT